jgi:uncharacterized protein YndB with AHSA1/START domain
MNQPETEDDTALVLTQRIAAPRETVFEFLVDSDKMLRWMGTEVDIEPEAGGKFWLNANGTDIAAGTYVEVDPPNRVVFTWGWIGSEDVPPGSSTVTISLTSDGEHTEVELRHVDLPGGQNDAHGEGWGYFLPRLNAVALGEDPGPNMHAN